MKINKLVKLTSDAKITGRTFDDESFEMSAEAIDSSNRKCIVYWVFDGSEAKELDDYNYDNIDRITYLSKRGFFSDKKVNKIIEELEKLMDKGSKNDFYGYREFLIENNEPHEELVAYDHGFFRALMMAIEIAERNK